MSLDWNKYLATGVPVSSGSPPPRKEIRTLKPEELWLFLQGMAKFQAEPSDNPLSYYQIAGIHGMPFQAWPLEENGVKPSNDDMRSRTSDGAGGGFCTHSSILFLTWHRPYIALFESTLYKHVNDIANGLASNVQNRATYVDLAKQFRMPYWDWSVNSPIFPQAALNNVPPPSTPQFQITGFKSPTYNPLYQYPFPSSAPSAIKGSTSTTVRYPNSGQQATQQLMRTLDDFFNTPSADLGLARGVRERNLGERVATILLSYARFGPMSHNKYRASSSNPNTSNAEIWGSLEDIHNSIHGRTGGGGHMGFTNIDRLFAIWQALHQDGTPETWVSDQPASNISWTAKDRLVNPRTGQEYWGENAKSRLYPFRKNKTTWYDSDMTEKTEDFGYTYPEIDGMKLPLTTNAAKKPLQDAILRLYPSAAEFLMLSLQKVETAGQRLLPQATVLRQLADAKAPATHAEFATRSRELPDQQTLLKRSLEPKKPVLRKLAPQRKYLEWHVNLKAEKHALGGTYSVTVFLGPVEEEAVVLWPLSPYYVGSFYPFGQDTDSGCAKCQDDQRDGLQITGQIPLTLALMERYLAGLLEDISVESVVPYLTENLHWRLESNGAVIEDRSQLPGLTVFVVSNEVTLPEDESHPPRYAPDVTIHRDVTTNRTGGGRGNGTGLARGEH